MHPEEGHKNDPRDRISPCKGRLRELGLFSLEKRTLGGDQRVAFHCLKRGCKKEEDKLFSRFCCDRTRGSSFKLREERLRLDIRKKGDEALAQVAQRGGGALSLQTLKIRLNRALSICWTYRCPCSLQGSWTN